MPPAVASQVTLTLRSHYRRKATRPAEVLFESGRGSPGLVSLSYGFGIREGLPQPDWKPVADLTEAALLTETAAESWHHRLRLQEKVTKNSTNFLADQSQLDFSGMAHPDLAGSAAHLKFSGWWIFAVAILVVIGIGIRHLGSEIVKRLRGAARLR